MSHPKIFHIGMCTGVNGLQRAFIAFSSDYRELNCADKELNIKAVEIAKEFKPDIVFIQIQTDNIITENCVKQLKEHSKYVVNFTGDVRDDVPEWYYRIGQHIDSTLFADMTDVNRMRERGYRSDYLNLGYDHTIYNRLPESDKIYDIVFMANNYANLFALSEYRLEVVNALKSEFGDGFKVFGNGWKYPDGNFNHSQQLEAEAYRRSKIAINLSHYCYERYSSDRMLRILGSGTLCMTHWYPEITADYRHKHDVVIWEDVSELIHYCRYYLTHEKEREEIAKRGHKNALSTSTFEHMVYNLITYYDRATS